MLRRTNDRHRDIRAWPRTAASPNATDPDRQLMTVATHAQRSQLADIGGSLPRPPRRRMARDHECARSHTRAPAKMARKSPPHPWVFNKTTDNLTRTRLKAAKFTPLAMTKSP